MGLVGAASMLAKATAVGILTGFPCVEADPPTENDGIGGAVLLGMALVQSGIRVTLLSDSTSQAVVEATAACGRKILGNDAALGVACFEPMSKSAYSVDSAAMHPAGTPATCSKAFGRLVRESASLDCLIAIERASPSPNGHPMTMRARSMSGLVAPLHWMFPRAVAGSSTGADLELDRAMQDSFLRAVRQSRAGEAGTASAGPATGSSGPRDAIGSTGSGSAAATAGRGPDGASPSRGAPPVPWPWRTACVGDGGNELGMGAVAEAVEAHVDRGAEIVSAFGCESVVGAGVSEWGAMGIAAAIADMSAGDGVSKGFDTTNEAKIGDGEAGEVSESVGEASGDEWSAAGGAPPSTSAETTSDSSQKSDESELAGREVRPKAAHFELPSELILAASPPSEAAAAARRRLLPSVEQYGALLDACASAGGRDGILGSIGRTVDGLDWTVHAQMLRACRGDLSG